MPRNRLAAVISEVSAVLCSAAWLVAGAAVAQPAPPSAPASKSAPSAADSAASTTVGEVVVRGRPAVTAQSFAKAVQNFVHQGGRLGPIRQVSRWADAVCPVSAGLSHAFDDFVDKRIREVAARVGAPGGDCRQGNVMVVFTTKPDELMADVRKHHEGLLGYHYVGETKSLAAFQPPMKSWYVTLTKIPGGDFAMLDQAYAPGPPSGTASRILPPLKSEFAVVLVVVDANLLEGQKIGPVADRIAMLVLSRPGPRAGCSPLPSVLDFLDPDCPSGGSIEGLTAYDEAYLKALYAYRGAESRFFERSAIARRVIKDMQSALPAEAAR